jgi:hypothetical protein
MGQNTKSEIVVTVRPVYTRTISKDSTATKSLSDDEGSENKSQVFSVVSLKDVEMGRSLVKRHRHDAQWKRWFRAHDVSKDSKRQDWCRLFLLVAVVLGFFCLIAGL